eukprot:TRINITY_DN4082_c0_g1_i1.p1 TRINITY_DN4082_c0_g1~~TRINITY_DN4082_c0_g1_i1.p1  ORF type:complete len:475 (+),score=24.34 TRINITY_DN4082_c0_g1_i1:90-1514(+)
MIIKLKNQCTHSISLLGHCGDHFTKLPVDASSWVLLPGESSEDDIQMSLHDSLNSRTNSNWGWVYMQLNTPKKRVNFLIFADLNSKSYNYFGAFLDIDGSREQDNNTMPEGRIGLTSCDEKDHSLLITLHDFDFFTRILRNDTWMADLIKFRPQAKRWKLSNFHLPGTHDSATFGSTPTEDLEASSIEILERMIISSFQPNWRCQDLDLYGQLMCGARFFDLRLRLEKNNLWWPCHARAYKTGSVLAEKEGRDEDPCTTLIGQMQRYIKQHPSEFIVIKVLPSTQEELDSLWRTFVNAFKSRLIPVPHNNTIPTYAKTVKKGRSILLVTPKANGWEPLDKTVRKKWDKYIWPGLNSTYQEEQSKLWREGPYVRDEWQLGSPQRIRSCNEIFMQTEGRTVSRDIFWVAQCQLTPSFGSWRFLRNPSWSPRQLSQATNPYIENELATLDLWRKQANIMIVDFPNEDLMLRIASMNL